MEDNTSVQELRVDAEAAAGLTGIARWGKFFGVLVLAGTGLFFLLLVVLWDQLVGALPELDTADRETAEIVKVGMIIVCLILAVIIGVLMSFLLKSASRIRNGLRYNDSLLLNSGLASLRNYFAMYAVLSIIQLLFSLIGFFVR
ncbi:MAG: hypothetical protein ABW019_05145 [Chitinophagaceae bacterium]